MVPAQAAGLGVVRILAVESQDSGKPVGDRAALVGPIGYVKERLAAYAAAGVTTLLVSPLAAPALCYDLRRDCSLVEHLVEDGRPTYLVEYGEVSFATSPGFTVSARVPAP